jgi:hypothetical protein
MPDSADVDPLASGSFPCPDCDANRPEVVLSFPMMGLLEKHRVEVHNDEETLKCVYPGCASTFRRRMTAIMHARSTAHRKLK